KRVWGNSIAGLYGSGAGAVPARPPPRPNAVDAWWEGPRSPGPTRQDPSSGASSRCSRSGRGSDALVEARDGPTSRSVLERQGEACAGRFDLEKGPRAADHGIGRCLLADDREPGDREPLVAPRDLTRTT